MPRAYSEDLKWRIIYLLYDGYFKKQIGELLYKFTVINKVFRLYKKWGTVINPWRQIPRRRKTFNRDDMNNSDWYLDEIVQEMEVRTTEEELLIDNPLYSGIIDTENIETQKPTLLQTIQKLDEWNEQTNNLCLKRIWDNKYYQERSVLVNEATFTHDILPSLLSFISPGYFKRWDQAQSISAKDRRARKFGDKIGTITRDGNQFEILFVEVSYGPFHPDPELHISKDNIKLGKLGKDSIDRIGKLLNTDELDVLLFTAHNLLHISADLFDPKIDQ
ncbi:hypothetical protein C2G38_2239175 [Gigaspora rosea]|uniref:Uncharacterized protein n=1 Tax=Gigaspora rosea TaxID=44941 RepID=A0A397W487_9GLOM|nr:hypothetical protein C2G38_2239175 [Gigaspora rosea]